VIEPEVQAHMESEAERQRREELDVEDYCRRVDALPYWVCRLLDPQRWNLEVVQPDNRPEHYHVSWPSYHVLSLEESDSFPKSCAVIRTGYRAPGARHVVATFEGVEPEPLDVCEAIVADWERIRVTPGWDIGSVSVTDEPYRDTDQREQLMAEAAEIVSLVCRKGGGYGDSFRSPTGALADTLFENSTRLHQKAMRLYWLTRAWSRDEAFSEDDESVEDTLRDLAGYCVLLLAEMRARHGE